MSNSKEVSSRIKTNRLLEESGWCFEDTLLSYLEKLEEK